VEINTTLAIVSAAKLENGGKYFFGDDWSLVDVAIAPWAVRDFIIRDYRGFNRESVRGWKEWARELEARKSVIMTSSVSLTLSCLFRILESGSEQLD